MAARKKTGGRKSKRKKAGGRKYSRGASKDVERAMRRRKRGTLRSGPGGKGGKVKSRKQAIAIGLSEARAKGRKVPRKRGGAKRGGTKRGSSRGGRKRSR
ncbi:MAG TPA: DUF6496 domain-containing protein [Gemmatimonadaceae bacterium]|nr:DUF6496 domain-containing protein [Gemmatimonadaceae bacterium]